MKKMVSVTIVLALALVALSTPAFAFEASANAYIGVYDKYLWRGFDLSDENDDFVVQPGTDVSIGDFTVSFWANISENTGDMNEVDLTIDYSTDLGELFSVSAGNIFYNVDGAKDTNELYLGTTLNTILEPTLTVYVDYDEFNTVYTTLGIGHSFDVFDKTSLSLGATASYLWDDKNGYGTDEDFFHNLEGGITLDYAATENISISAMVLHSTPLSDDTKDITGIEDETVGGVSISYAF